MRSITITVLKIKTSIGTINMNPWQKISRLRFTPSIRIKKFYSKHYRKRTAKFTELQIRINC